MSRIAKLYQYQIAMQPGAVEFSQRKGLLLSLQQEQNQGWGEIAPLVGESSESLDEAISATTAWIEQWQQGISSVANSPPSVAFGVSCAMAELQQQLPQQGNYQPLVLCNGDPDELFTTLNAISGEKIARIQIGLYESVRDGMIVNMLLEAIPDLKLRLEGSHSWTLAKAHGFAKYINPDYRNRILYLSEPCRNRSDSVLFSEESGIALGLQAHREQEALPLDLPSLTTLIIHPMLVGSIDDCKKIIDRANQHAVSSIISSSLESSFGLTQLARIAQQLTPQTQPNLNTLDFMRQQLIRPWPDSTLPVLPIEKLELIYG